MNASSTTTAENRLIVATMYSAASSGNFKAALECMDENIVVHEPPFLPYGDTYTGLNDFQKLLGRISEYADISVMKLHHMVAEGERVVAVLQILDRKTGKNLHLAEHSTLRNGKIVEMQIFYFDAGSMIDVK